jgi:hypothetical protein
MSSPSCAYTLRSDNMSTLQSFFVAQPPAPSRRNPIHLPVTRLHPRIYGTATGWRLPPPFLSQAAYVTVLEAVVVSFHLDVPQFRDAANVSPTLSSFSSGSNALAVVGGDRPSPGGYTHRITIRVDHSTATCFDPADKELYDLWAPKP